MLDIDGLSLTPADRDLLREPAVGGVILFSRNYDSPEQIIDLVAEIRALRSPPLIVAVDHEGGRVQRFREGFSAIPPMRRIGREFNRDSATGEHLARQAGWLIGAELRAVSHPAWILIGVCPKLLAIGHFILNQRWSGILRPPSHADCVAPVWWRLQNTFRVTGQWLPTHT
jgi:beta-glucosidase-like glycosyl hydrolase